MTRLNQALFNISILGLSWLGMMAVHELGHVVGAWFTGGVVSRVVLNPLTISRTELSENPSPRQVAWAGPILGTLIPLMAWAAGVLARIRGAFVLRFFAGFCLVANGTYLGVGAFGGIGDAGDLLRHGARAWQLWAFGLLGSSLGLLLWHRQSAHFGLGRTGQAIPPGSGYLCLVLMFMVAFFEWALSSK